MANNLVGDWMWVMSQRRVEGNFQVSGHLSGFSWRTPAEKVLGGAGEVPFYRLWVWGAAVLCDLAVWCQGIGRGVPGQVQGVCHSTLVSAGPRCLAFGWLKGARTCWSLVWFEPVADSWELPYMLHLKENSGVFFNWGLFVLYYEIFLGEDLSFLRWLELSHLGSIFQFHAGTWDS